jgi:IclR family mhp operon transcriptional activator
VLQILRYVNSQGQCKAAEIAAALDIPRPTVYRLLQTLEQEGYVTFSSSDNRLRVTSLAASLGDNAAANSQICQVAGPLLNQFTSEHTWPIDLSIYDDAHMVIQETTHARSPLSVDRGMTGYPLPMLRSSAGRAYLGACDDQQRVHIVDHVRSLKVPEDRPFLQKHKLEELLLEVRKKGYALRDSPTFRPKTASIAMPVMVDGTVAGCVSTIWVSSALDIDAAVALYERPLRQVAEKLATRVGAS